MAIESDIKHNESHSHLALKAGFLYFLQVFLLGFVLGTIRVLWVLPKVGSIGAVLLELPLMIAASWFLSSRIINKRSGSFRSRDSLAMGLSAFIFLMIAEFLLSVGIFGLPLSEYVRALSTLSGVIGLFGQIAFALIPYLQIQLRNPSH